MKRHYLDIFMEPVSVAVIGASRKTGEGSFNVIENMREFGYQGKIYPVNPKAGQIAGLHSYKSVKDIPGPIELAIIATPREEVPRITLECARIGIKGAVVVPQGFADADEKGKQLQHRLTEIAREYGIRIMGPNTLGTVNAFSGFTSSFMPLKREKVPVGIICQSGIFFVGSSIFTGMMGKGIDIANGCDIDFADALEYFGDDDEIRLIFLHIEGLKNGRALLETARKVSLKKPIIALKTARTQMGAEAASSHSGALVGDYEVFEAAFRQAGIISAREPDEIFDYTKALLSLPLLEGNRLGLVTFTGAGGIILADTLQENGLELSDLSPETVKNIKELSPSWMPIQNPLDIWPALMKHGMEYVYETALRGLLNDKEVDGAICIAIAPYLNSHSHLDATRIIKKVASDFPEKPVVSWLYGPNQLEISRNLEEGGRVVAFPTLARLARTLSVLHRRALFLKTPPPSTKSSAINERGSSSILEFIRKSSGKIEGEKAQSVLEAYGIPMARSRLCRDKDQIMKAAEEIGYPVALKVSSPQIIHKSDLGGIHLGLANAGELEAACRSMSEHIKKASPGAEIDGFLIQQMAKNGVEVFLGGKRDAQFGPLIVFGSGGIYAEVWRDTSYGICPLSRGDAERMLRETVCFKILKGARKDLPYDTELILDCMLRLSQLMMDTEEVSEIDINPFMVFHKGGLVLDARLILRTLKI